MKTKESTLNRLCRLMSNDDQPLKADPSEFQDDPDLDNPAELERMNLIMDFIEDLKTKK